MRYSTRLLQQTSRIAVSPISKRALFSTLPLARSMPLGTLQPRNSSSFLKSAFNSRLTSVQLCRNYSVSPIPTEKDVDNLSSDEYHTFSDETMDSMLTVFEELCEVVPDLDVELSQGVLSLTLPPNGSYVINKQPPNKQIWWSSPLSGPKRFDLVNGVWTSLRDGSTLQELLEEETKIITDMRNLPPVKFVLNE